MTKHLSTHILLRGGLYSCVCVCVCERERERDLHSEFLGCHLPPKEAGNIDF